MPCFRAFFAERALPASVFGPELRAAFRLDSAGSLQGWAGANVVIWNSTADSMEVRKPPTAQNWVIGGVAGKRSGDGFFESFGRHVQPRSLYRTQLKDRLGP